MVKKKKCSNVKITIFCYVMMCDLVHSNCVFQHIPCLPCRGGKSSFKMLVSFQRTKWHHVLQDSNLPQEPQTSYITRTRQMLLAALWP